MGGYIGATAVGLTTTAADVQGDITSTDTTPELILKNTSEEDTEGGREGKITFKGEQSGGEESTLAQIESAHDGTSDDQKGDLIFKTNDGSDGASPTEAMRIDSSQNVGIGTTSPSAKLHVSSGTSGDAVVLIEADTDNNDEDDTPILRLSQDGGATISDIGIEGTAGTLFTNSIANATYITTTGNTPLQFATNDSARMTIMNTTGRVGIGTTSPQGTLSIVDPTTSTGIEIQPENVTDTNRITNYDRVESAYKKFRVDASEQQFYISGSSKAVLNQYGQLGINKTPETANGSDAQLHVGSSGQYNSGTMAAIFEGSARGTVRVRSTGDNPAELFWDSNGGAQWLMSCRSSSQGHEMRWYNAAGTPVHTSVGTDVMKLTQAGNLTIDGALSKGSGSFKIDHPLPTKSDTHHLVHSFLEGPQADLIYRGKVDLVDGSATVNIDTASGMTDGTFVLLCDDVQCFTSNEDGWTAIKGSVSGNTLTITAQDNTCTDTISWMVIGERKDQHMIDTDWTDENGKVIVEPLKPQDEEEGE